MICECGLEPSLLEIRWAEKLGTDPLTIHQMNDCLAAEATKIVNDPLRVLED